MVAVGSDIVYAAITKIVGSAVHLKQKTVDMQLVRRLAYGSVPGAIIGSILSEYLNDFTPLADEYLKLAIGLAISCSATLLLTAGIVHLLSGNIDWGLTLGLLIGSIPGVLLGSRMVQWVPRTFLKTALVLILFFLGGQLIYRFFF